MAIAMVLEFPDASTRCCSRAVEMADDLGVNTTDSQYTCFETTTGYRVMVAWDTDEEFARFRHLLGPVLAKFDLGTEVAGLVPTIRLVR